jgi:hypothetical protein
MPPANIFKVVFANQGRVYEIYARKVGHGTLFGFVEVEELIFGERSAVVVDPSEEKIQAEFAGVKRTYLPLHSVIRIDEVRKSGVSKVSAVDGSNVTQFPFPVYTPGEPGSRNSWPRSAARSGTSRRSTHVTSTSSTSSATSTPTSRACSSPCCATGRRSGRGSREATWRSSCRGSAPCRHGPARRRTSRTCAA